MLLALTYILVCLLSWHNVNCQQAYDCVAGPAKFVVGQTYNYNYTSNVKIEHPSNLSSISTTIGRVSLTQISNCEQRFIITNLELNIGTLDDFLGQLNVQYRNGSISKVLASSGETQRNLNIARSIVSLFQAPPQGATSYNETDIFGNCPTKADAGPNGIIKTKDLKNCDGSSVKKTYYSPTRTAGPPLIDNREYTVNYFPTTSGGYSKIFSEEKLLQASNTADQSGGTATINVKLELDTVISSNTQPNVTINKEVPIRFNYTDPPTTAEQLVKALNNTQANLRDMMHNSNIDEILKGYNQINTNNPDDQARYKAAANQAFPNLFNPDLEVRVFVASTEDGDITPGIPLDDTSTTIEESIVFRNYANNVNNYMQTPNNPNKAAVKNNATNIFTKLMTSGDEKKIAIGSECLGIIGDLIPSAINIVISVAENTTLSNSSRTAALKTYTGGNCTDAIVKSASRLTNDPNEDIKTTAQGVLCKCPNSNITVNSQICQNIPQSLIVRQDLFPGDNQLITQYEGVNKNYESDVSYNLFNTNVNHNRQNLVANGTQDLRSPLLSPISSVTGLLNNINVTNETIGDVTVCDQKQVCATSGGIGITFGKQCDFSYVTNTKTKKVIGLLSPVVTYSQTLNSDFAVISQLTADVAPAVKPGLEILSYTSNAHEVQNDAIVIGSIIKINNPRVIRNSTDFIKTQYLFKYVYG